MTLQVVGDERAPTHSLALALVCLPLRDAQRLRQALRESGAVGAVEAGVRMHQLVIDTLQRKSVGHCAA